MPAAACRRVSIISSSLQYSFSTLFIFQSVGLRTCSVVQQLILLEEQIRFESDEKTHLRKKSNVVGKPSESIQILVYQLFTKLGLDWLSLIFCLLWGGGGILQSLSSEERKQILLTVAEALVANEARIKTENEADVEAAQLSGIAKSLIGRLTIKPGKVSHNPFQVLSFQKDPFIHVVIMLLPC